MTEDPQTLYAKWSKLKLSDNEAAAAFVETHRDNLAFVLLTKNAEAFAAALERLAADAVAFEAGIAGPRPERKIPTPLSPLSPLDQAVPSMPPIKYQLERLKTMLYWISEHMLTFRDLQGEVKPEAEDELDSLVDVVGQARSHFARLEELLHAVNVADLLPQKTSH